MGHGHKDGGGCKAASFVIVGALTLVYCVAELIAAVWLHSLTLLSDGFHNLSDVVSLYIAHWAQRAAKKDATDKMSYGWARTEILGALTNGCFLLSLCIYVGLESIPRFIHPEEIEAGWWFIIIAGAGLGVNTFGTIMFAFTGVGHAHSHGGGGHGHDHGHGHAHKDKKKDKEHGHSHSHGEKKEKKKDKHKHKHDHDHDHDHDVEEGIPMINKAKAPKQKKKMDVNTMAVFLHYLGDAISSLFVLGTGLLLHFFKDNSWAKYLDPASSLVIIAIILYSTIPLVKRCAMILLQGVPNDVELKVIRERLQKAEGVVNIHDFHVWQLVDGMVICSVHVTVDEGADFTALTGELKKILHQYGIHSSTIQPEFVAREFASQAPYCEQNCVQECEEDWCCKKTAEKTQFDVIQNYTSSPPVMRASSAPQSKSIQYDNYQSSANGHSHGNGKEHGHGHGHDHGHGHSGSD